MGVSIHGNGGYHLVLEGWYKLMFGNALYYNVSNGFMWRYLPTAPYKTEQPA